MGVVKKIEKVGTEIAKIAEILRRRSAPDTTRERSLKHAESQRTILCVGDFIAATATETTALSVPTSGASPTSE